MFVDEVRVQLRAGAGGAGSVAFRKARGKPRGKPEGGNGGSGGAVVLEADDGVATLLRYRRAPHHRAGSGTHGSGDFQHGRSGDDLVLAVPVGTVVRDEAGTILADLARPGQRVTVLEGGRGGRGNAAFVGARHHAPDFAEQGEFGDEAWFTLELKLMADAALIGFPNAGKSTLIARVSAARPKIADYPFTTLVPNLGVVSIAGREYVLADIPGLIEGAAEGRGLGSTFLRHVERCRALVIMLDPSPLQELPVTEQHRVLLDELRSHDPGLAERPTVVVVGKSDLPDGEAAVAALRAGGVEALLVSAVTGSGIDALMHAVADAVEEAVRATPDREGFVLHRPGPPGFEISRADGVWVVTGKAAERAVGLDDLTKPEAADLAASRLAAAGVDESLRAAGAQPGDDVRIGDIVFEFRPDPGEVPDAAGAAR